MSIQESLSNLMERLQSSANVKNVYGDPIETQGKTVIPTARLMYGFGGGSGRTNQGQGEEGGGGGGGMRAIPVGMVEITPTSTRFIPFRRASHFVMGAAIGAMAAALLCRKKRFW